MLKETLINATEAAATVLLHYFSRKNLRISNKEGINNLVTEADHAAEKAVIETIQEAFPDHFILSEEAGEIKMDSAYKWIIDPIDGTTNYAHGIPVSCVSIAVEHLGTIIMGAVYSPMLKEFYLAERNQGATLNGAPIRVSDKTTVMESCVATGFPYKYLNIPNGPLEVFERFIRRGIPIRRFGSAAIDLCWVAAGRFDGYYEHSLNAWDSAAGFLMVEEAGGKITDFMGNPYSVYQPRIVASNGHIHDELLRWVNGNISA